LQQVVTPNPFGLSSGGLPALHWTSHAHGSGAAPSTKISFSSKKHTLQGSKPFKQESMPLGHASGRSLKNAYLFATFKIE
jgi:hypothetical protein